MTPEHLGWKADLLWPYIVWRFVLLKELSLFIAILPSSHFLSVYKHPQVSSIPLNSSNLPVPLFQGNHWPPKYPLLSIPLNPHPAYFLPLFHRAHLSLSAPTTQQIPQSPLLGVVFTWPLNIGGISCVHLYSSHHQGHLRHCQSFNNFMPADDSEISPEPQDHQTQYISNQICSPANWSFYPGCPSQSGHSPLPSL